MTEQAQQITGEQATAQLAEKLNNSEWRTAWLAGNGPQRKEYDSLMAAKHADAAMAGDHLDKIVAGKAEIPFMESTTGGQISTINAMKSAEWLHEANLTDPQIKQALSGQPVAKAEYEAIKILRSDRMGNKEFVAKWLGGDVQAHREMLLMNTVMANGYVGQERTR
jgi:hypothetical protein